MAVKWANMASFSTATDLFNSALIPGVTVWLFVSSVTNSPSGVTSVENVKGRGMYLEVLWGRKEVKSGG